MTQAQETYNLIVKQITKSLENNMSSLDELISYSHKIFSKALAAKSNEEEFKASSVLAHHDAIKIAIKKIEFKNVPINIRKKYEDLLLISEEKQVKQAEIIAKKINLKRFI